MYLKLNYFFKTSFRRKQLDLYQKKYIHVFHGKVADIGGRQRGIFERPEIGIDKWIIVDVVEDHKPDVVADVADMHMFADDSFDVVSAFETFEHVANIDKGISECIRILKPNGVFIISVPFLYPVHGDPFDFQRWTDQKWQNVLEEKGMKLEKIEIMGRVFNVFAEIVRAMLVEMPVLLRKPAKVIFLPLLVLISKLDCLQIIKNNKKLGNFHGGYFIIARKNSS